MKLVIASAMLVWLGLSSVTTAADMCADPQDQATMNQCADKDYKAADAELNAQYGKIIARLADNPDAKQLLIAAQRSWIAYRDAECAFRASGVAGGSIYPYVLLQCTTELTNLRLEIFDSYSNCEEGDTSCPVPPAE